MGVSVKRATLWRTETGNTPGTLARTLQPLAAMRENLEIVMGYAYPDRLSAAIEIYPVQSASARKAARSAGLNPCDFPCLVVNGNNRPGLGHQIAQCLADAGINLNFFVAQVIGRKYTGVFGFEAASEADLAVALIRKATKQNNPSGVQRQKAGRGVRPRGRKR